MDVKQAVGIAIKFMTEIYTEKELPGLLLEEFEFSSENDTWRVTLGFDGPARPSPLEIISGPRPPRAYKVVTINAKTGGVVSMKMRD